MQYGPLSDLNAGTFSWSARRERIFNSCRRAYFFHYYAANHGISPESASELRHIRRLKNLKFLRSWTFELINCSLLEVLLANDNAAKDEKSFYRKVERSLAKMFQIGRLQLLDKSWLNDAKTLNLFEVYYDGMKQDRALDSVRELLRSSFAAIKESRLNDLPLDTSRIALKYNPGPIDFNFNNFPVWLGQALTFYKDGEIHINVIEPDTEYNQESGALRASLYKMAAAAKNWGTPDRVRTFYFRIAESNITELEISNEQINLSETMNMLESSAVEMRSRIKPGNRVDINDFPVNATRCERCRYKEICPDSI